MTPVFLDTVGLIALWDKSDQWHAPASAAFHRLLAGRTPVVTTAYVLLECGNAAARRPFRLAVERIRRRLDAANALVIPDAADWEQAWAAYARGMHDSAGIVDQISFVVMRRMGLNTAFSNDNHFRAAGFGTLF